MKKEKKDKSPNVPKETPEPKKADAEKWKHSAERQYEKGVVDEESEPRMEIDAPKNEGR